MIAGRSFRHDFEHIMLFFPSLLCFFLFGCFLFASFIVSQTVLYSRDNEGNAHECQLEDLSITLNERNKVRT